MNDSFRISLPVAAAATTLKPLSKMSKLSTPLFRILAKIAGPPLDLNVSVLWMSADHSHTSYKQQEE